MSESAAERLLRYTATAAVLALVVVMVWYSVEAWFV
jgi:hypothetical protein